MTSLPDVAKACGYIVISNHSPTVMEIEGLGNWPILELACRKFVLRGCFGHPLDHVTVVYRYSDGRRTLLDVGINGVRYGDLPPVGFEEKRKYAGLGVRGVRKEGRKFRCQMTVHGERLYLGLFATIEEAGRVRDQYAIDHGLTVVLNYPQEELVTA